MDYAEFGELAKTTVRGTYGRIPGEFHEDFEGLSAAANCGLPLTC